LENNNNFVDNDLISTIASSNLYNVYIDQEISEPENYRKVFDVLQKVSGYDRINIIINTPGGNVATTLQLFNGILRCPAFCTAFIYKAYSAGSMIALACDAIQVEKFGSMMIHTACCGFDGKTNEIDSWSKFINKMDLRINKEIYFGFLSEKEIDKINNGCDIWLNESEINQRLKKWKPLKNRGMI